MPVSLALVERRTPRVVVRPRLGGALTDSHRDSFVYRECRLEKRNGSPSGCAYDQQWVRQEWWEGK